MTTNQKVLVAPRDLFAAYHWFVPWETVKPGLDEIAQSISWKKREEAEASIALVQPISCAVVRDQDGKYCIVRRGRETRADLKNRITLTFGGHVDQVGHSRNFAALLNSTLRRELEEELGILDSERITPLGLIIDTSSVKASRHVAFVHEVVTDEAIHALAGEEFSLRSKLNAHFLDVNELEVYRSRFDPWSQLIFDGHINKNESQPRGRQYSMTMLPGFDDPVRATRQSSFAR